MNPSVECYLFEVIDKMMMKASASTNKACVIFKGEVEMIINLDF